MEDVLATYSRTFNAGEVLVCLDETSKQQTKETRTPLPPRPGQRAAYDFEYERNGTANLFMMTAPLEGWRHVKVTDRRTKQDFADVLKDLADVNFPDKRIILVMDNLTRINSQPSMSALSRRRPSELRTASRFITHQNTAPG